MKTASKGYIIGGVVSIFLLILLSLSDFHSLRMPNDLHNGHEALTCNECHEKAEGSFRQQIQANLHYLLGQRSTLAAFNFSTPDNKDCLACHEREDDRHPVYRFNEPRFSEVRKKIQPQLCSSCHQQHKSVMFTADSQNCRYCHKDMRLKNDLLVMPHTTSHQDLIKHKRWDSCLACHDFHGNHMRKIPITDNAMLDKKALSAYLAGKINSDPYANKKTAPAKETRYEN